MAEGGNMKDTCRRKKGKGEEDEDGGRRRRKEEGGRRKRTESPQNVSDHRDGAGAYLKVAALIAKAIPRRKL